MRMAGSVLLLLTVLLIAPYSHAFVSSTIQNYAIASKQERRQIRTRLWLCSMVTDRGGGGESNTSTHTINRQLDELAEKCSDPSQHVILLASQCEDLFHNTQTVDIVSFNTVLKAWAKTCGTLADATRGFAALEAAAAAAASVSIQDIHSIPVYTARDAAERATNLLLEMEGKVEEGAEHSPSSIVPDTSSYNSVIGMLLPTVVLIACFFVLDCFTHILYRIHV